MTQESKKSIALGVVTALITGFAIWLFTVNPPAQGIERRLELTPPYSHDRGFAYTAAAPHQLRTDQAVTNSANVSLMEDGRILGPAGAPVTVISEDGKGAFSLSGDTLTFSASDNSDPNDNGKRYTAMFRVPLPAALYLGVVLAAYLVALVVLWALLKRILAQQHRLRLVAYWVANGILFVAVIQAVFWILVDVQLLRLDPSVRACYRSWFRDKKLVPGASDPTPPLMFTQHHYLNYVLNPDATINGTRQINDKYLIRRSEKLRSRNEIKWRALTLGGSTTFCTGLDREADTWPHILEQSVRQQCGPDCEVINGGVPGYSTLENFIHYVILLRFLEPDLVILYEGINDVHPRLFGNISPDYSNYRKPWRSHGGGLPAPKPHLSALYAYRYVYLNKIILPAGELGIEAFASKKGPSPAEWPAALQRNSPDIFRSHLDALVRLIRSSGTKVAVIPSHFVVRRPTDVAFIEGVRGHNLVNREISEKYGLPFAQKIVQPGVFERSDTRDNCHFTVKGSHKMAGLIFDFLSENGLLPENCSASSRSAR